MAYMTVLPDWLLSLITEPKPKGSSALSKA
jgi:hypothetical protein